MCDRQKDSSSRSIALVMAMAAVTAFTGPAGAAGTSPGVGPTVEVPSTQDNRSAQPSDGLSYAASRGDLGAARRLIAEGADIDAVYDRGDGTPLIAATRSGNEDTVRTLLAAGADSDERGRRPPPPVRGAKLGDPG